MVLLEILVVIFAGIALYLFVKNLQWKFNFENKLKEWTEEHEKKIREDAISRSSRTLSGKTLEKLIPFLERFNYDPHDVRWLGDPIDLVIFDKLSEKRDPEQIIFLEVKSGESKLTKVQQKIRELVDRKKVRWEEFRI